MSAIETTLGFDLFKQHEKRDPAEVLPNELPEPIEYESHRQFVKDVLKKEAHLRARGTQFVDSEDPNSASVQQRKALNEHGAPSEIVAAGYRWIPTEAARVLFCEISSAQRCEAREISE